MDVGLVYELAKSSPKSSRSSAYSLSDDITTFIPSCAQTCFLSFLDANFPTSICSTKPTLDCLCTHKSPTGFTVGEGALQCIVSEDNIGFCQGTNSSQSVASNAYNMCFGKVNAIPNTHPTLTATLIVETSKPSIVQVAQTTVITASPRIETMTTVPKTTTAPVIVSTRASTRAPTAPFTSTSTKFITMSATAAASQETPTESSASPMSLTAAQISGIVIAAVGVIALVAGGLFVLACLRRRRRIVRDSDLLPFQHDPGMHDPGISLPNGLQRPVEKDPNYYGPRRNPNIAFARKFQPTVPAPPPEMPRNTFARSSIPAPAAAEEIGVAISPDTSRTRHVSKLLPPRVDNPGWVPQVLQPQVNLPASLQISDPRPIQYPHSEFRQDRFASELYFDENGTTSPKPIASNTANDSYRQSSPRKIPRTGPLNRPKISMPRLIVPEAAVQPLNIQKRVPQQQPRAPSSVYSPNITAPPPEPDYGRTENPHWRPRPQLRQEPKIESNTYSRRHSSASSVTSIDTHDSSPETREPEMFGADLSPVVESPVGRSPVSYPTIPGLSPTYLFTTPSPRNDFQQARSEDASAERRSPKDYTKNYPRSPPKTPTGHVVNGRPRTKSPASVRSNSSSLLDKRRGAKKVGALTLKPDSRKPNWTLVGRAGEGGMERGTAEAGQARFMPRDNQDEGFPMSPRELTPQRRGDDYILQVG